ncbi:tetratricopeptide (TPR) repeat protein [Paenibacillus sp. V4I3]|nr:tetratricopeptide (TPR) repeat protein [Paenibacillus sp. V4I3]
MHLEQYRHATFEPEAYYLEGLKRDPSDSRINVAYGTLLLRRGLFNDAEGHFRTAVKSLTWRNPNPYDSEALYQLGVALKMQGRLEEAFAALYKSTWSAAWQDAGYFSLAQIACEKKAYAEALELVERSLVRNSRNYKARHLKAALLRKLGQIQDAITYTQETLALDIADFGSANERYLLLSIQGEQTLASEVKAELMRLMRGDAHNYLNLASDYANCGLYEEAIELLDGIVQGHNSKAYPMLHYTLGYLHEKTGQSELSHLHRKAGNTAKPDYFFPNSLFDLQVLSSVISVDAMDDKAHYYLGNWYYDKRRHDDAITHWEASRSIRNDFATVHRNLSLAYFNKRGDAASALIAMEKAFACRPDDARVFYELDQLYKKLGYTPETRCSKLEEHQALVNKRDDLYVEYITLLNAQGYHEKAIQALDAHNFHPWEGGEGKVTGQHVFAHIELAKRALAEKRFEEAVTLLNRALLYPDNLGEGKLSGAQENNVFYYLGLAHDGLKEAKQAQECFIIASQGLEEPASAMYYNDQPPDMIFYQGMAWLALGNDKEAKRRFNKLIDYAEKHLFDEVKFDYFAVSLPDFLVFEDDLNVRNEVHCRYMMGLGHLGLGHTELAKEQFEQALRLEANHTGSRIHRVMCS